jgi:hypothetical protein
MATAFFRPCSKRYRAGRLVRLPALTLRCRRSTMPRDAAALSFEISSVRHRTHVGGDRAIRFGDEIEGPQLQALEGGRGPCWVSDETITTGQIFSCRIICRAVIPSSFGMLMSIETTSGRSSGFRYCVLAIPCQPTRSRSADAAMIRLRVCRIKAESSATVRVLSRSAAPFRYGAA